MAKPAQILQTTMTNWSRSLGIRPTRGRREGRIVGAAVVVEGEVEVEGEELDKWVEP